MNIWRMWAEEIFDFSGDQTEGLLKLRLFGHLSEVSVFNEDLALEILKLPRQGYI
jgi:hypothetical protein